MSLLPNVLAFSHGWLDLFVLLFVLLLVGMICRLCIFLVAHSAVVAIRGLTCTVGHLYNTSSPMIVQ